MSDETPTEHILAGIAQVQRDVDGPGPAADAIDRGRQAIALLRRVPKDIAWYEDVVWLLGACAEGGPTP